MHGSGSRPAPAAPPLVLYALRSGGKHRGFQFWYPHHSAVRHRPAAGDTVQCAPSEVLRPACCQWSQQPPTPCLLLPAAQRLKRFAVPAFLIIACVRGMLLNFGVYYSTKIALGAGPFAWSPAITCVPAACLWPVQVSAPHVPGCSPAWPQLHHHFCHTFCGSHCHHQGPA